MFNITGTPGNDRIEPSGVNAGVVGGVPDVGDDTIDAGGGSDFVDGGAGDDSILGGDANDRLRGSAGDDTLDGGAGTADEANYDTSTASVTVNLLTGTASDGFGGTDTLLNIENAFGGTGNDSLTGDANDNNLFGNFGNDTISGDAGNDTLDGNNGNDTLIGGDGNDILAGGFGDDSLDGGDGVDTYLLSGSALSLNVNLQAGTATGNGTDTLAGIENAWTDAGNDTLTGSTVANELRGGLGNDSLTGAEGDDTLEGGRGNDVLAGGTGFDTADYRFLFQAVTLTIDGTGSGTATSATFGTDALSGIERILGSSLADTLTATAGIPGQTIYLVGNGGNDTITGPAGGDATVFADYQGTATPVNVNLAAGTATISVGNVDTLVNIRAVRGTSGGDTFTSGVFDDLFVGGLGNDTYAVNADTDTVVELDGQGTDTVITTALRLTLAANVENLGASGAGDFKLTGNSLDNVVTGGGANDKLAGKNGDDTLIGAAGADRLDGGRGDDSLNGGADNDRLAGGAGADTLTGGTGKDRFLYAAVTESRGSTRDTITDFVRGDDRIDLSAIDADGDAQNGDTAFVYLGASAFTGNAGEVRIGGSLGAFLVEADIDGDSNADLAIDVQSASTIAANWFIL